MAEPQPAATIEPQPAATIEFDADICVVSGMCTSLAPQIFRVSDDRLSLEVLQTEIPSELVARAERAEACCPMDAIKVTHRTQQGTA